MAKAKDPARSIPSAVKRAVRQRCGFGCVYCGVPLYEYEHMMEWAQVKRHVAEEITLLCVQHHREKTYGLLPVEDVKAANADPFALRQGQSAPYTMHYSGPRCRAVIGGNRLSTRTSGTDFFAVAMDAKPIVGFRFEDGHYLLNVSLFNEKNHHLLEIHDNELVYSAEPWDIEFVANNLVIRAGKGDIFIDITFEVPDTIVISRGRLCYNRIEFFIQPSFALLVNDGSLYTNNGTSGCSIGFGFGNQVPGVVPGFGSAGFPRTGVDRTSSVATARAMMRGAGFTADLDVLGVHD